MKIALLGDIAPFGRCCVRERPNLLSELDKVAEALRGHDVVIGNLETPFIGDEKPVGSKSAHVKSHPDNVMILRHLGVTHVTLANNHIFDYGVDGYNRTTDLLEKNNIGWFGTEDRSLRLEVDSEKIALLGYCSLNTNPSQQTMAGKQGLNLLDVDRVMADMEDCRQSGYLPIVAVHSGQEHVHTPSSEDVAFARKLASKYSYVYYGHHPHVIQGKELVDGSPIFYSLGNFLFDDVYTPRDPDKPLIRLSEANRTGIVVSLDVQNGAVQSSRVLPIHIGPDRIRFDHEVSGFAADEFDPALRTAGSDGYNASRGAAIESYIGGRRSLRDMKWYLRRLNPASAGIILAARRNAKRHAEIFSSKVSRWS
ncbi:CapA family protein [Brevundimonas sp.]|uniref:CapA family protein n=1 Tax=Brevundimonas sp. TaxID=1871086 RepID=UPI003AF44141